MADLWDRAQARIPGGVNSPVRAFQAVGGRPFFVDRAEGAFLWDTEGNRYCDYVQSWGASILGHAHPAIVKAVQDAAAAGTSYGAPTEAEVRLAEAVADRVPSVEKLRLVNSGTEAAMTAVRLARAVTGRHRIMKFAGGYHGHVDALLAQAGSGVATLGLPGSAGVPEDVVAGTVVVPFNDTTVLDEAFADVSDSLAAVLVEGVPANMGLVPPAEGFLAHLRQRCDEAGTLLILDEVITGFRVGPGGAQERYGLTPDLSMFGKVLGGGLPLAAVGGPAELMDDLAPLGPVYQAGTLSGNPLATAAGLAVLGELELASYGQLEERVGQLARGLAEAIGSAGLPVQVPQVGTLLGLFFSEAPVHDYAGAKRADAEIYGRFFHGMLERGVFLAPSAFEAIFVSLAHTSDDIDRTIEAAAVAATQVARAS
ncbi:MAG: glutamate-1-semialdehyde 2,1-aminomutase [Actinobacteria bacterium]|nr:glutamate-1-semialdehyde 2,1-aminomutase [Actinomycetota bacterium]